MLLAVQTGLRVSELIGLNCRDVTLGTGANVRCEGKGRKQRTVPLGGPVQALLRGWLTERAGHADDPLFPTRTGRRLSRDAVALRVSTHATAAAQRCPSLQGKQVHPHVLRHSCAMSLLQAGVDTSVIALWLGHAGVRSTDARARRHDHERGRPDQNHPHRNTGIGDHRGARLDVIGDEGMQRVGGRVGQRPRARAAREWWHRAGAARFTRGDARPAAAQRASGRRRRWRSGPRPRPGSRTARGIGGPGP